MKLNYKFASIIFNARLDAGLTQSQVAECVGITIRWYQRIESGQKLPGTLTMLKLILFFNVNLNELREDVEISEPICSNVRKILKTRR